MKILPEQFVPPVLPFPGGSPRVGDHFILLNVHDPVPLRYQFQAEFGGTFSWEYLERGPSDFRVKISKLASVAPVDLQRPCGH